MHMRTANAFVPAHIRLPYSSRSSYTVPIFIGASNVSEPVQSSSTATAATETTTTNTAHPNFVDNDDPLGLTPELRKITNAFQSIGDDKLRYKQLLYMATQLPHMDDTYKVLANKVPGCLSTVHVQAILDRTVSPALVYFSGDSDGLLTKGLVALLVRGLSGNPPASIQNVDPSFIQVAGIAASLTPGRNNGFLNMLAVMKRKALELVKESVENDHLHRSESAAAVVATSKSQYTSSSPSSSSSSSSSSSISVELSDRPKYGAMMAALQTLQPEQLELTDNSHQHAGHAGHDGKGESHFELRIVAHAFEGLNLVKRHKLIYTVLGEIMPWIHALQIRAQTPQEAKI